MFIARSKFKTKSGKIYESVLLRESYRENGQVKKRTVANLSRCSEEEIRAIELALTHKHDLSRLGSFSDSLSIKEGLSIGGVWVIYEVAKKLGIVAALGASRNGQLALWQIFARVLEQGSRLSAVRLGTTYAMTSVLSLKKGFNEDALYRNLAWLANRQTFIEDNLFAKNKSPKTLFLYDVTSSYLEGTENALADWGYNRDEKKGKMQIVVGLLIDEEGSPIATEVFKGNTNDLSTFHSQVEKWASLCLTVEEGLRSLSTLTLQEVTVKEGSSFQQIPEPREENKKMLGALGIELPKILPKSTVRVVTRKNRRKTNPSR